MSDFFKKIRSIETTEGVNESAKLDATKESAPSQKGVGKETTNLEGTSNKLKLRPASSKDEMTETFSSGDEPDNQSDTNLADMALPGFLTRGLMEKGKAPLKSPSVRTPYSSEAKTDIVYKTPSKTVAKTDSLETPSQMDQAPIPQSLSPIQSSMNSQDTSSGFAYSKLLIFIAIFFWLVIASAISYGFFDLGLTWRTLTPISLAGLSLFIMGPAVLIGITAYSFAQLSRISRSAGQLERTALALMQPDETVSGKAEALSAVIKNQIDTVDARLEQAQGRMADMEGIIRVQSDALEAMRVSIETSTHHITHTLQTERSEFESVSTDLDEKMRTFVSMVSEHSNNLARISKVAGQQITEARISTEGIVAKMNAASELVRQNTLEATASLKTGHEDIEHLGEMILKRSQELDSVYTNHAKDLTHMIEQLRDEQENLGVSLEARLAKMRDVSVSAKASAESLTVASESGRKTVVALAEAANITEEALRTRFSEMEKMVEYSHSRAENISQMAARRVQSSLALTRKEIARIEMDMQSLQDKLNTQVEASHTPDLPPSNVPKKREEPLQSSLDVSHQESPKRKGLLRFRPIDDVTPNSANETTPNEDRVTNIPNLKTPIKNVVNEIELNPYDMDSEIENFDDSLAIPDSSEDDAVALPNVTTHPLAPPTELQQDSTPHPISDALQVPPLSIFKNTPDTEQDGLEDTLRPSEDVIKRITRSDLGTNNDKPKWSLRNIFKSPEADIAVTDMDDSQPLIAKNSQPSPKPELQISQSNQEQIIATLTGMGLSPGAIVDDGCIIEAANSRRSNGASAMSHTVSNRLKEPVNHLRGALELNPELKSDARAFTSQFQIRLDAVENDRESIRTRLESESGRAFLLCDAALNG